MPAKYISIADASTILNIEFELLKHIAKNIPDFDMDELEKRTENLYNKYLPFLKHYSNEAVIAIQELFNVINTFFPYLELKNDKITASYNGFAVDVYFEDTITFVFKYHGIRRHYNYKQEKNILVYTVKEDNQFNDELTKVCEKLDIKPTFLDKKLVEHYYEDELMFRSFTTYEANMGGRIINSYNYNMDIVTIEKCLDENNENAEVNYYKCELRNGINNLVFNGDVVKRPHYLMLQYLMPEDSIKDVMEIDYFWLSPEEYQKFNITTSSKEIDALLLSRKKPKNTTSY